MRLINVKTSRLEEFLDYRAPPYAILSHTWGDDCDELSFRDVEDGNIDKPGVGSVKFQGCCQQAEADGLGYAWIDTCCIDKTNLVELSEAINSMFRWYQRAKICYAYLSDVPSDGNPRKRGSDRFQRSRWFQRGWTLQELLAPKTLRFYSSEWRYLGTKGSLSASITKVTGIPRQFLLGIARLDSASVAQRMSWAAHRDTNRKEDLAYCLLGIFDITMPMIYGEGGDRAFFRLQEQIMRTIRDDSILAWGLGLHETFASDSGLAFTGRILAAAPSDFANSGNIIRRERSLTFTSSVEMSGGNLRAYLSLFTTPAGQIIGLLNCGPEDDLQQVIGIPLIKLTTGSSEEYARPRGCYSVLQPATVSGAIPKPIQIKHDSQETVAIDSDRVYYHYEDDEFAEVNLSLVDVVPEPCWDKERALIMSVVKANDGFPGQILVRLRHDKEGSQDFVIVLDFKEQSETQCCILICNRNTLLGDLATNLPSIMQKVCGKMRAWNGFLHLRVTLEPVERQPIFVIRLESVPDEEFTTIDATVELEKRRLILESMKILKESENNNIEEEEMKEREKSQADYLKKLKEEKEMVLLKLRELKERERILNEEENEKSQELYNLTERQKRTEERRNDVSRRWLLTQEQLDELQQDGLGNRGGVEDVRDVTPLQWACGKGHIEEVKQLVDEGAVIGASAKDGWTPIIAASRYEHVEVTRILLENGANIEDKSKNGITPLLAATAVRCLDLIQLLLDKGADIEAAEDKDGATALSKNGTTPLLAATAIGCIDLVQILLNKGADIEAAGESGVTPLLVASASQHIDVARLLLDEGAEMEAAGENGITPLLAAATVGCIDMVRLLLDRGANIEAVDENGITALMIAAANGNVALARLLLATGKNNLDATDEEFGNTAMDWAVEKGHEDIVKLLQRKWGKSLIESLITK
ncbi:hypothetical protein V8C37DRAFT_410556 [Trichoderma ceciliae]